MVEKCLTTVSVDIGCGPKNNLALYDKHMGEPTLAIDSSEVFLRERNHGARGNLVLADAQHLPIASGIVDNVFLTHVLEHVDSAEEVLSEIERITSSGSQLFIAVPHSRFESVMSKLDKDYHSPKMHQRVVRNPDLKHMLEGQGFYVELKKSRGFMTAIAITLTYIWHLKIKKDRRMQEQSGRLIAKSDIDNPVGNTANHAVTNSNQPFMRKARQIYHRLENHSSLGKLFIWNTIYPFENFMRGIKKPISDKIN